MMWDFMAQSLAVAQSLQDETDLSHKAAMVWGCIHREWTLGFRHILGVGHYKDHWLSYTALDAEEFEVCVSILEKYGFIETVGSIRTTKEGNNYISFKTTLAHLELPRFDHAHPVEVTV